MHLPAREYFSDYSIANFNTDLECFNVHQNRDLPITLQLHITIVVAENLRCKRGENQSDGAGEKTN